MVHLTEEHITMQTENMRIMTQTDGNCEPDDPQSGALEEIRNKRQRNETQTTGRDRNQKTIQAIA